MTESELGMRQLKTLKIKPFGYIEKDVTPGTNGVAMLQILKGVTTETVSMAEVSGGYMFVVNDETVGFCYPKDWFEAVQPESE